ncbi:MAG: hypothetical protein MPI82_06660 [Nitrosopumilus sp.]|nr:hypothetical protein [Nitrosopumilus sp.]
MRAGIAAWCLGPPSAMMALLYAGPHVDGFPVVLVAHLNIVPVLLGLVLTEGLDHGLRVPDTAAAFISVYAFWAPAGYVAHSVLGAWDTRRAHAAWRALKGSHRMLAWCAGTPLAMLGFLHLAGAAAPALAQYAAWPNTVPLAIYGALRGGAQPLPLEGDAWAVLLQAASLAAFWSPVAYYLTDLWGMMRYRRPARPLDGGRRP